ncbi:hypothetical protein ABU162_28160 [Paenibacillus thiaminolyticus]|uniref:hypothetical protein n=1 Tax=Paenibacillus thiaminolyticus TaxID=49283 RepID=UPI0035A61841
MREAEPSGSEQVHIICSKRRELANHEKKPFPAIHCHPHAAAGVRLRRNGRPPPQPPDQRQDGTPQSTPEQTDGSDTTQPIEASRTNDVTYDSDPVTLKFIIEVDDETFRIRYKEQIEAKFPNITLEQANASLTPEGLQELNARGDIPDLYVCIRAMTC